MVYHIPIALLSIHTRSPCRLSEMYSVLQENLPQFSDHGLDSNVSRLRAFFYREHSISLRSCTSLEEGVVHFVDQEVAFCIRKHGAEIKMHA